MAERRELNLSNYEKMKINNNPLFKSRFGFVDKRADAFCDTDTPDYVQQECGTELGGIPFVALFDSSIVINEDSVGSTLESASFWTGNIAASPSNRFVILNTRGSKAAGTPTEEEGFGFVPTQRTGDDKELTFEALGVMDNRDFWASVNQKSSWQLVYGTAGKDENGNYNAFYAKNVSVYADDTIEQSIKSRIRYTVSAKWSTAMVPSLPFHFPASVITSLS